MVLYGHTLMLPWSLIDDGLFFERSLALEQAFRSGDLDGWWGLVWTPEDNRFGPGLIFHLFVFQILFGQYAALWHLGKLLLFAATCSGMLVALRTAGFGRTHGIVALLLFALLGRPTVFPDFQTHFSNWQRLHTTDSYYVPFAVWSCAGVLMALQARGGARWAWGALALVALGFAALIKVNVLAYAGGLAVALGWIAFLRRQGDWRFPLWLAGIMLVAVLPGLFFFRPWSASPILGYTERPSFSLGQVAAALEYYGWTFLEGWGVALALAIPWGTARLIALLRRDAASPETAFWIVVPGFGLAMALAQALWPIMLPRYLVNFTPFVALLVAVPIVDLWRWHCAGLRGSQTTASGNWALPVATGVAAVAILAASAFVTLWGAYTLWRFAPFAALAGMFFLSVAVWGGVWAIRRRQSPWVLLPASALFFGSLYVQLLTMGLYAWATVANNLAWHRANWAPMEALAQRVATLSPDEPRPEYQMLLGGEPAIQFEAFVRAFGIDRRVTVRQRDQPEPRPRAMTSAIRGENYYGLRSVPQLADGYRNRPLAAEGIPGPLAVLRPGGVLRRRWPLAEGTVVTGLMFRASTPTWPPHVSLEARFRDTTGLRVTALYQGSHVPYGNEDRLYITLEQPFLLEGDYLEVELRLVPPHLAGSPLERYMVRSAGVLFAGATDPLHGTSFLGRPMGDDSGEPARWILVHEEVFRQPAYLILPPGSLLSAYYQGAWPYNRHSLGWRPIEFRYDVSIYKTASAPPLSTVSSPP